MLCVLHSLTGGICQTQTGLTANGVAADGKHYTILGIGVVSEVVRLTLTMPAPIFTVTFLRVTVR